MTRDENILKDLDINFAEKLRQAIHELRDEGYTIKPVQGLRTLQTQAKLWRRGRSTKTINDRIESLRNNHCHFLADTIHNVGPQKENTIATNAIPGLSWHNWGRACDFLFFDNNGHIVHNGDAPCYKKLAEKAEKYGLTSSLSFKSIREAGHIQADPFEVLKNTTLKAVNDHFEKLQNETKC